MIIKIWDYLFTRRIWNVVETLDVYEREKIDNMWQPSRTIVCAKIYVMKDQFGNIKEKRVNG